MRFQEPYFSHVAVEIDATEGAEKQFFPALTDKGICHVYNGQTVRSTFNSEAERIKQLSETFDKRDAWQPKQIVGTGRQHQVSWWINVKDK